MVELRRERNGTVAGCGGNVEEMEWNSGGLWRNWGGNGMEQWWAVVEMRRKWNKTAVGCGGTEEEMEWNSGGLWWS